MIKGKTNLKSKIKKKKKKNTTVRNLTIMSNFSFPPSWVVIPAQTACAELRSPGEKIF